MNYANGTTPYSSDQLSQPRTSPSGSDAVSSAPLESQSATAATDSLPDVVEIYLQQAEAYCNEQQWDKAVVACQEALQVDPAAAVAYKLLGNVLMRQGKLTDAMGYYAKALTQQPNFPEVYNNLGSLHAKQKAWDMAIAYFKKALAQDPKLVSSHLNLAKTFTKLGETAAALQHRVKALALSPSAGSAQDHYQVGQSLEADQQIKAAIQFYQQSIARDADFLPAYQRLADLLEDQGDWEAAVTCYRQVLRLGGASKGTVKGRDAADSNKVPLPSTTPKALPQVGQSSSNGSRAPSRVLGSQNGQHRPRVTVISKQNQQLIQRLMQASSQKTLLRSLPKAGSTTTALPPAPITAAPASTDAATQTTNPLPGVESLVELGEQHAQAERWSQAIQCFLQAARQSPTDAVLYRNLAIAFARNQQLQQSAEAWYRAFSLEPDWPSPEQYVKVGHALAQYGKTEAAMTCYRQAIRQQPDFALAYQYFARLLKQQGQPEAAKQLLTQFAAKKKKMISTVPVAATTIATGAKPVIASSTAGKAILAHKQGEILQQQGDWKGAIAAYRQAIQLNSKFSWSCHNLGDCCRKMGDWQGAIVAYRRSIQLNPEFIWSYFSLGEALEQTEQWSMAAQAYQKVLRLEPNNTQVPARLAHVLHQLTVQHPRDTRYYKQRAELLLAQDKLDEAISVYQMALQIQPDDDNTAMTLSKLLAERDPQQAMALLDRALTRTQSSSASPVALALRNSPLFDAHYYRACNPALSSYDDAALLNHYLTQGRQAGRQPNPLFDEAFYRQQHPDANASELPPLLHYQTEGYKAGYDPHPFFQLSYYCQQHADVAAAELDPLTHYLAYGAKEGRAAFAPGPLSPVLNQPTPTDAPYLRCYNGPAEKVSSQRLGVYCSSLGNYFITEIADFVAAALTASGHSVTRLNEQDTPPDNLDDHWVVAPHEFFYLGDGVLRSQALSGAVMVNVEQPQTTWFSKAFHYLRSASLVLDINVKSAAILSQLGLPAYWLPLGHLSDYAPHTASTDLPTLQALASLSPQVRQLPDVAAPLSERPLDLHFIGTLNARREQFFAESANWLSRYSCFLHMPPMGMPLLKGQDQALDTEAVIGLSRRSKILLNIHRDELPYFEWHRMVFHGLWQNTLVVTEPCHDIPGLTAGEHYIECSLDDMADKVDWLLNSSAGQAVAERVRQAGHEAITTQFDAARMVGNALALAVMPQDRRLAA